MTLIQLSYENSTSLAISGRRKLAANTEGGVFESDLEQRIDAVFAEVIDAQEDAVGKRHKLIT